MSNIGMYPEEEEGLGNAGIHGNTWDKHNSK